MARRRFRCAMSWATAFTVTHHNSQGEIGVANPEAFPGSGTLYRNHLEIMAERVAFATECEFGSMHVNPDYSYVEIVDSNGQATRGAGYVVGTTFHNLAMPLVRYKLSDRTRWISGGCRCGRPFPMIEPVTGKVEDSIFGSNGAFVSPSVLTFAFKGVRNIRKSQ